MASYLCREPSKAMQKQKYNQPRQVKKGRVLAGKTVQHETRSSIHYEVLHCILCHRIDMGQNDYTLHYLAIVKLKYQGLLSDAESTEIFTAFWIVSAHLSTADA